MSAATCEKTVPSGLACCAQGKPATNLCAAGSRWNAAQRRLADSRRLNPLSLMPPMLGSDSSARVGVAWRGKPLLDAQQVEDVVAYLLTLK